MAFYDYFEVFTHWIYVKPVMAYFRREICSVYHWIFESFWPIESYKELSLISSILIYLMEFMSM